MLNQYIKEILREYDRLRQKNKDELEAREEEIYERLPRIKAIEKEMKQLGVKLAKKTLDYPDSVSTIVPEFEKITLDLQKEKLTLLVKNGYPADYLQIRYHCEDCKDHGYLENNDRCHCFKQRLVDRAYNLSNLPRLLEKENFQHFNINLFSDITPPEESLSPRENMMNHLNEAEGFVLNFYNPETKNLVLYGPTGLGKTFLANCIAKALLDKGLIVIYQTAFSLIRTLEDLRFHQTNNKDDYTLLFESDLLIVDDLGTELTNSFTNSEIFNLINSRLLKEKKTILSTNLTPKALMERYDDRIFSRVANEFHFLRFYGNDLRWENG